MSTVRFSELVKRHGRPEIISLWTKPEENSSFLRAVKQGRVLTLSQQSSSKHKDSGEIGFHQKPHAAYLVFPKTLREAKGIKVIGIKYDLIKEPDISKALPAKASKTLPPKERIFTSEKLPTNHAFNVRVRRVAVLETTLSVEAKTKKEARKRVVKIAEGQSFDLTKASIKTEALR